MFGRLGPLLIACLLLVLNSLAGCGTNATNGTAVQSPVTMASSSPASVVPAVSPTVTASSSPPVSTGSVTVGTDAPSYRTGDAIAVTLSNQGLQIILFPDHLTNCTVVLLQSNMNGSWESLNLCKLMIVTRIHSLDAGHSLIVRLLAPPNQWLPGLYRVKLSYGASQQSNHVNTIYSAVFQVG